MSDDWTPADEVTAALAEVDAGRRADVVNLDEVRYRHVSWLWPGRLPVGKLVVLDGDPATGKSTLMLDLAARVSTGRDWPDDTACPEGDVLLLSAEDGLADTIAPRLVSADAKRNRIHALLEVPVYNDDGDLRYVPPQLPRDVPLLERVVTDLDVRLVVVDVLMAYLSARVDSHRDQDVRGVLHELAAMAERTAATIVLIRHMNKTPGTNALYRGGGSIGIVGAARAAFLVARDPDDNDRRIFAVTKSNLAPEPPALAYRLVSDPATGCARVEWEPDPVDGVTASSLLAHSDSSEDRTERDEAADWLTSYLEAHGGTAPTREVIRAARAEGIAERTLKRARARAGVDYERRGFQGGSMWTIRTSVVPFGPFMPAKSAGPDGTDGPDGDPDSGPA